MPTNTTSKARCLKLAVGTCSPVCYLRCDVSLKGGLTFEGKAALLLKAVFVGVPTCTQSAGITQTVGVECLDISCTQQSQYCGGRPDQNYMDCIAAWTLLGSTNSCKTVLVDEAALPCSILGVVAVIMTPFAQISGYKHFHPILSFLGAHSTGG